MLEASSFREATGKTNSEKPNGRPLKLEARELETGKGDEGQNERSSILVDREKDRDEN